MLLEGIFLPLTTPFHADGRLFLHKLALNVEHYSRTQASGMLVLGAAGEPDSLNDEETRAVLAAVADSSAREKVLLAGVGRDSVRYTLELARFAAEAGYDAIALRAPGFCGKQLMERDTMTYFLTVADQSPLPVVVLAEDERPVRMDVIGSLTQHPNVIGAIDGAASSERCEALSRMAGAISREATVTTAFAAVTRRMAGETEAAGNLVSAKSLGGGVALSPVTPVKTRTKRIGFQYLTASTDWMLIPWQCGASGAVPRLGAAAPQACCEVWQAFKDGDEALALEKQARIQKPAVYVQGWHGISTLKYACDLNAYFGGPARLPLLPPAPNYREGIERELAGLKN